MEKFTEEQIADAMAEEEFRTKMESYLVQKFSIFQSLRSSIDKDIKEELKIYNSQDDSVLRNLPDYMEKVTVPFVYSQVQTVVPRIMNSLFGGPNWVRLFADREEYKEIETELTRWVQEEMDKIGLKKKSRDFIEAALTKRTSWLVLRPVNKELIQKKTSDNTEYFTGKRLEYDIHPWEDVWFDTRAREVEQSDFFIKKVVPLNQILSHKDKYFNLESVKTPGVDPRSSHSEKNQAVDLGQTDYSSSHYSSGSDNERGPNYHSSSGEGTTGSGTDLIDIYEYHGVYDFSELSPSDEDYEPDVKEIFAIIAGGNTLIYYSENKLETKRKRLIFPIRPIRQANSLIGKSIPQLTRKQAVELNLAKSFRLHNMKVLSTLLFKHNQNADIDIEEIFNGGGNSIPWDESPDDIMIFQTPNTLGEAGVIIREMQEDIQVVTGGVDAILGSGGQGTARGEMSRVQEASFKFQMMAENVAGDIVDFVNYCIVILVKYNSANILMRHPKLTPFLEQSIVEIEDNCYFDIELFDQSQRRDIVQAQWTNMVGVAGPLIKQEGGNMSKLLTEMFKAWGMSFPERIMTPETPDQILSKLMSNPQLAQQVMQALSKMQAEQMKQSGGQTTPAPVQVSEAIDAQNTQELT